MTEVVGKLLEMTSSSKVASRGVGPRNMREMYVVDRLIDGPPPGFRQVCLMGNHDLHLLAVAQGVRRAHRTDTLNDILDAPDREAWLEWEITPTATGARLDQRARFQPRGLWGRAYWYGVAPFHRFIFQPLARRLAYEAALAPAVARTA